MARNTLIGALGTGLSDGIGSRITIMKEHLRGFKKNGIKNNIFNLSTRYFSKVLEYRKKR